MNLLQRRLFAELAKVFCLSLAVLLVFILMGRALQLRDMLLGLEMGVVDTLRLFGYLSPFFLLMVCPVACMLAVFLTFLRMSTDRELIALKAGGVSLYQLLPASLFFGLLCSLLALWISLVWQAWGMGEFRNAVLGLASSKARVVLRPGVFNKEIPGMVFFARRVDPIRGTLSQVLVEDQSRGDGTLTILAPEGNLGTDYEQGELLFLLRNGRIYSQSGGHSEGSVFVLGFDEYVVRLALDSLFRGLDMGPVKPKEMAWDVLAALPVDDIALKDARLANKIVVERHKRLIFPAACLVLCIFAIPIASSFQGLHRQSGLVLALVLFLIYYSLLSMGISLGESGGLSPWIGLWGPNVLFLLLGLYGIHLSARERMPHLLGWVRTLRQKYRGSAREESRS